MRTIWRRKNFPCGNFSERHFREGIFWRGDILSGRGLALGHFNIEMGGQFGDKIH